MPLDEVLVCRFMLHCPQTSTSHVQVHLQRWIQGVFSLPVPLKASQNQLDMQGHTGLACGCGKTDNDIVDEVLKLVHQFCKMMHVCHHCLLFGHCGCCSVKD